MERFNPEDFELLDVTKMSLLRDREQIQDKLRDTSLAGQLLFMHQRGFSSVCSILDNRTEVRMFQNGVVRFMHEKPNGNIVVYGQYRPELCLNERLRLPKRYIDQFNGGIIRVEYDRKKGSFDRSLVDKSKNVCYGDMVKETQSLLFKTRTIAPWDVRMQSVRNVMESFAEEKYSMFHSLNKNPPTLPRSDASSRKYRQPKLKRG